MYKMKKRSYCQNKRLYYQTYSNLSPSTSTQMTIPLNLNHNLEATTSQNAKDWSSLESLTYPLKVYLNTKEYDFYPKHHLRVCTSLNTKDLRFNNLRYNLWGSNLRHKIMMYMFTCSAEIFPQRIYLEKNPLVCNNMFQSITAEKIESSLGLWRQMLETSKIQAHTQHSHVLHTVQYDHLHLSQYSYLRWCEGYNVKFFLTEKDKNLRNC